LEGRGRLLDGSSVRLVVPEEERLRSYETPFDRAVVTFHRGGAR
jgi:hypothetical protein